LQSALTVYHLQSAQYLVLRSLHWTISVAQLVAIKIALLVWKCVHGTALEYLQELCVSVEDVRGRPRLRSASTRCIQLLFTEGEDVNGTAKFCVPWAVDLQQFAINFNSAGQ